MPTCMWKASTRPRQAFAETTALHPDMPKLAVPAGRAAHGRIPLGAASRGAGAGSKRQRVAFPAAMAPMLVRRLWRRARWWQLHWCSARLGALAHAAAKQEIRFETK